MQFVILLVVVVALVSQVSALVGSKARGGAVRGLKPLQENFFIDLPTINDPSKATPAPLLGEDTYRDFVASFDDAALLNKQGPFVTGGTSSSYDPIDRVRVLKLLTLTAESGLLEALEARGLTLTQVEKLLPLADKLGLLGLVKANKGLAASAAPLLIEPAPSLIPILVSVLKTPPATFTGAGVALAGAGAFEVTQSNALLGAPLVLLGLPLLVVGSILGSLGGSLPAATSYSAASAPSVGRAGNAAPERSVNAPSIKATRSTVKVSSNASGGSNNGRRKVVRVN